MMWNTQCKHQDVYIMYSLPHSRAARTAAVANQSWWQRRGELAKSLQLVQGLARTWDKRR